MENQNSFDILAHQSLMIQQIQHLNLQLQLREFQSQGSQGYCGGNQFNGVCSAMEGGYDYQPQFDHTPRNNFYPQENSYLPTMMEYPDFSYDSPYSQYPDHSPQFMSYPQDYGSQDFYQPYCNEIPNAQEEWQQSQDISPSLESALMGFMQRTEGYIKDLQASQLNHEPPIKNLEEQFGLVAFQNFEGPNEVCLNEERVSLMEQCNSLTTSVIHIEEEVVELTPKVNDEEFTTFEEEEELQVIEEQSLVECQDLELEAILPPIGMPKTFVEDGSNHYLQPKELIPYMKKVEDEAPKEQQKMGLVHSKPLFEEGVDYILQSHEVHPILMNLLNKETIPVFFDPKHFPIPWDPGGNLFNKFFPYNFKPP